MYESVLNNRNMQTETRSGERRFGLHIICFARHSMNPVRSNFPQMFGEVQASHVKVERQVSPSIAARPFPKDCRAPVPKACRSSACHGHACHGPPLDGPSPPPRHRPHHAASDAAQRCRAALSRRAGDLAAAAAPSLCALAPVGPGLAFPPE